MGSGNYHSALVHALRAPFPLGTESSGGCLSLITPLSDPPMFPSQGLQVQYVKETKGLHTLCRSLLHPPCLPLLRCHSCYGAWGSRVLGWEPSNSKVQGVGDGGERSWGLWEHARDSQTHKLLPGSTTERKYRLGSLVLNLGEIKGLLLFKAPLQIMAFGEGQIGPGFLSCVNF